MATVEMYGAFTSIDCGASFQMKEHFFSFRTPLVWTIGSAYSTVLPWVNRDVNKRGKVEPIQRFESYIS